jgi:hypothetical protein
MSDRILVTGATGLQGGAVARHLLKLGKPEVRCLTRRPDSEAAKTFKQLGAEVVKADLDDPASLKSVLRGCTGVFGVTDFWEAFLREYDQGVNLIDAASEAGVGHLVLSTLPSAAKVSNGAIAVPHFETKARMEEHVRLRGVPFTFVHVAFYFENFINYFPPQRQADGNYGFGFPLARAAAPITARRAFCSANSACGDLGQERRARLFQSRSEKVVLGYYQYHAVPGNTTQLRIFKLRVCRLWQSVLVRRSQRAKMRWERFTPVLNRWIPPPRVLHPYPNARFYATHPS